MYLKAHKLAVHISDLLRRNLICVVSTTDTARSFYVELTFANCVVKGAADARHEQHDYDHLEDANIGMMLLVTACDPRDAARIARVFAMALFHVRQGI